MYCPVCFQNTLKIRSSGVIKLSFNGKSRNTSLFTYNLQKESQDQLEAKLKEKIVDFFSFYSEFANRTPIKTFEAYSGDFVCMNNCKIDMLKTKVSVIGIIYPVATVKQFLKDEGTKWAIEIDVNYT
jgi:hypothetical protein